VTLWAAGIEGSLRALDPLVGAVHQHPVEDQEPVLFALIAHAVNHQLAMYSLALDGYYMESLGLVRACVERWLAWLYVTNFPNHASRFLRPEAGDSPEWGEMLKKLEQGTKDDALRQWWNWLNKLAHVDQTTLGLIWEEPADATGAMIRVGPTFDRKLLENCVGEASAVIPPLLQVTEQFCMRYGVEPAEPGAAEAYAAQLKTWM